MLVAPKLVQQLSVSLQQISIRTPRRIEGRHHAEITNHAHGPCYTCLGPCYTEKASPTRHRPERQHNARANLSRTVCIPQPGLV